MIENHTKYLELPMRMRCVYAKITCVPNKNFSGNFGYNYPITCINELVTAFIGAYGEVSRSFWYDPNDGRMWADGGSQVNDLIKCGHFSPAFYTDETLIIMLSKNEITENVYSLLVEKDDDN